MTFGLVLDPAEAPTISGRVALDLNSGPIRVDQGGIDWGDAQIQTYMAEQGRVGAAPVDYIVPNRTIVIPLAVFTDELTGIPYDEAKRALSTKVARIQQEGGVLRRMTDTGAYSPIYADIVDASLNFPDIWGETAEMEPNVRLTLTALPDFYGAEVTLDLMAGSAGSGDVIGLLQQNARNAVILGDHPARCRITLTDTSGNDQRGVFGGFRSRYYDSAPTAKLAYEAETMTTLMGGITETGIPAATNGTQVHWFGMPPKIWTPVLSTDLIASGPLTHKGNYQVLVRVYTNQGDQNNPPIIVRLAWSVGSTIYLTVNPQTQVPAAGNYYIIDLGQVSLMPAPIGSHYWRGTVQVFVPGTNTPDFWIDRMWLQPLDESSFRPTAPVVVSEGTAPLAAWDSFGSLGSGVALSGRTPNLGPNWHTENPGTDFSGAAPSGGLLSRATVSEGSYQFATVPLVFTDTEIGGDWMITNFPPDPNSGLSAAALARFTDVNNYASFGYFKVYGVPFVGFVLKVAGVVAVPAFVQIVELPNTWITLDFKVLSNGQMYGAVSLQGQSQSPIWQVSGYHASCAAGGTLASGKPGILDANQTTTACTRYFDNVFARNLSATTTRDAVIFGSRSAELRHDGFYRLDANGVVGSPISRRGGDFPRLPVSGLEGRPVELLIDVSRGDFATLADPGQDAVNAQVRYRPCWLLAQ